MSKAGVTFAAVKKIGLTFPGVEEGTAYGSPALKVRGKLMACIPTHRTAEPGSLAVIIDRADRAEMLASAPDIYYITDHYLNYDSMLVRLARVNEEVLHDLLGMAHKFVTAKAKRNAAKRRTASQ